MTAYQWFVFFLIVQVIHFLGTCKLYEIAGRKRLEAAIPVYNAIVLMKTDRKIGCKKKDRKQIAYGLFYFVKSQFLHHTSKISNLKFLIDSPEQSVPANLMNTLPVGIPAHPYK